MYKEEYSTLKHGQRGYSDATFLSWTPCRLHGSRRLPRCGRPALDEPAVEQRADAAVQRHTDGYYYFTATVPNWDYIELRRATTLEGLRAAEPKTILKKHATGPMGGFIWAPEIHFIDGKWFIYFGASSAELKWDIRL